MKPWIWSPLFSSMKMTCRIFLQAQRNGIRRKTNSTNQRSFNIAGDQRPTLSSPHLVPIQCSSQAPAQRPPRLIRFGRRLRRQVCLSPRRPVSEPLLRPWRRATNPEASYTPAELIKLPRLGTSTPTSFLTVKILAEIVLFPQAVGSHRRRWRTSLASPQARGAPVEGPPVRAPHIVIRVTGSRRRLDRVLVDVPLAEGEPSIANLGEAEWLGAGMLLAELVPSLRGRVGSWLFAALDSAGVCFTVSSFPIHSIQGDSGVIRSWQRKFCSLAPTSLFSLHPAVMHRCS